MLETIKEKLREIEERENVKILHCVESGSRAWGFASPDSDYDVRFIYVRPREYYLRLDKTRDVIEWQLDDTLDISGWDLQKALRLLYKSNPTVFEWNLSPIVYKTTEEWKDVSAVINSYFNPKSGLYHYLNTARSTYKNFLCGETVKYKKYFYVLRPLLSCKWVLKEGTPPPMLFDDLKEKLLDECIRPDVEKLLELKKSAPEIGESEPFKRLNDYLADKISEMEHILSEMPEDRNSDWETLNSIFLKLT